MQSTASLAAWHYANAQYRRTSSILWTVNWIFVSHFSIRCHYILFFLVVKQLDGRSQFAVGCRLPESLMLPKSNEFPMGVYYIVKCRTFRALSSRSTNEIISHFGIHACACKHLCRLCCAGCVCSGFCSIPAITTVQIRFHSRIRYSKMVGCT